MLIVIRITLIQLNSTRLIGIMRYLTSRREVLIGNSSWFVTQALNRKTILLAGFLLSEKSAFFMIYGVYIYQFR